VSKHRFTYRKAGDRYIPLPDSDMWPAVERLQRAQQSAHPGRRRRDPADRKEEESLPK